MADDGTIVDLAQLLHCLRHVSDGTQHEPQIDTNLLQLVDVKAGPASDGSSDQNWVRHLVLRGKSVVGKIYFGTLPRFLVSVDISNNRLSGGLDLSTLPHTLAHLNASYNRFSELIDLGNLPAQLQSLNLASNQFSGKLDLSRLPDALSCLYLQKNRFTGIEASLTVRQSLTHRQLDGCSSVVGGEPGGEQSSSSPSYASGSEISSIRSSPVKGASRLDVATEDCDTFRSAAELQMQRAVIEYAALPISLTLLNLTENPFSASLQLVGQPRARLTIWYR